MRIAVNTRLLLPNKLEGIGWFTYHTLQRIVKAHPEHEFVFFFDRPFDPQFVFGPNVIPVVAPPPARHPVLFCIWFDAVLPLLFKKYRCDLFLSTDGQMSLTTSLPTCLVVHDLAFEHYPQHLGFAQRSYWRYFSPKFAKRAKTLVTVSEFSRQDIAARYKIDPAKITVACNGAHEAYRPMSFAEQESVREKLTAGCQYFLFAGALHPRKNVTGLLKAFIAFKRHHRSNMKLVIVGRMAWKFEALAKLREEMPFKDDVIWVGYMGVEELSRITGAAYAMVYASLFEGFGIPILEALQCGVPVIASNTSSMPEVTGDAGLLVDPRNPDDIAAKMGQLYRDEDLRSRLIKAAPAQVAKFSWDKAAAVLWDSIERTAKENPR